MPPREHLVIYGNILGYIPGIGGGRKEGGCYWHVAQYPIIHRKPPQQRINMAQNVNNVSAQVEDPCLSLYILQIYTCMFYIFLLIYI